MKSLAIYAAVTAVGLLVIFVIMFGARWFNAQTVQSQVIKPKQGVECVVVTTTDGAAVDCWRVE